MKLEKEYLISLIEQVLQEEKKIGSNLKNTSQSTHQASLRKNTEAVPKIDLDPKERALLIDIENLLTMAAANPGYKLDKDQRVISLLRQIQDHLRSKIPSK
jgi:hypothetical protein